jgi:DNA invertase Pin-like site-specific DNA recombinase
MNVTGYVRVSTREQGDSGLGLEAQKRRIADECRGRDWRLEGFVTDVGSGTRQDKLPNLRVALDQLDRSAGALMVVRLDRLSRSLGDFAQTIDRARRCGWTLVILDPAIDMTSPWGEALAGMGAVWAQLEAALISQRTKAGLAIARDRGTFRPGERTRYTDRAVIARLARWRARGLSLREIARRLDAEGVPSPSGGPWQHKTVDRILARERERG